MVTLTQIFYTKLCEYPQSYLISKDGRKIIASMAKMIKRKEGRIECKYFLNLLNTISCID